jgi:hypothetical protein
MVKKEKEKEENGTLGACAALVAGRGKFGEVFDWSNSQDREGVCFHCGKRDHVAAKSIADMPADVKSKILDRASA